MDLAPRAPTHGNGNRWRMRRAGGRRGSFDSRSVDVRPQPRDRWRARHHPGRWSDAQPLLASAVGTDTGTAGPAAAGPATRRALLHRPSSVEDAMWQRAMPVCSWGRGPHSASRGPPRSALRGRHDHDATVRTAPGRVAGPAGARRPNGQPRHRVPGVGSEAPAAQKVSRARTRGGTVGERGRGLPQPFRFEVRSRRSFL